MSGTMTKPALQLLETLERVDRPMTRRELASIHMYSEREIRRAIAELNDAGYPVVSVGSGFSLAKRASLVHQARLRLLAEAEALVKRANRLGELAKTLGN